MGRKDYNKGMEAGARPFEEKFRQEQKRNQEWKQTFEEKFDNIKETNDAILDEMDSREKEKFYKLHTIVDIKDLEKGDRETLLSLLFTLAETQEEVTELQQLFLRSVKKYLENEEDKKPTNWSVLKDGDWSVVESIYGVDEIKAIAQAVMGFLFLGYGSHEAYMEDYEDLFECFNLNKRGFVEIREQIDIICRGTGLQGFAEMYGYVPEGTSSDAAGSEGLYGMHDEEGIGAHGKLAELRVAEEIGLEDGEEKVFENTKIIFEKGIKGAGGRHAKDTKLVFKNCEIIALGEKTEGKKVIISDLEEGEIIFESCTVTNEKCVLIDCEKIKLAIKDSCLNCGLQIYNDNSLWGGGSASIRHCRINLVKDGGNGSIFSCGELEMADTSVCGGDGKDGVDDFHLSSSARPQALFRSNQYHDGEKRVRIEKCRFYNISDLLLQGKSEISHSDFENCCIKICDIGWGVYGIFSNCEFQDCIFAESYGGMDFKDSKLLSCMGILPVKRMKDVTLDGGFLVFWGIEDIELVRCKFLNWSEKSCGSIVDKHGKNPFSYSHLNFGRREQEAIIVGYGYGKITGCQFENMDLGEKYLIGGAHVDHATFEIKNCHFKNIKTSSGGLFRKEFHYIEGGFFRDKKVTQSISVITENCTGL